MFKYNKTEDKVFEKKWCFVFFNKCIHNRRSKKARRKREHGRHFPFP